MQIKTIVLIKVILITTLRVFSQNISGNLSLLSNKTIRLEGFNGLNSYLISSASSDEKGNFKLTYAKSDYGVGYLIAEDKKPLFFELPSHLVKVVVIQHPEYESFNDSVGRGRSQPVLVVRTKLRYNVAG